MLLFVDVVKDDPSAANLALVCYCVTFPLLILLLVWLILMHGCTLFLLQVLLKVFFTVVIEFALVLLHLDDLEDLLLLLLNLLENECLLLLAHEPPDLALLHYYHLVYWLHSLRPIVVEQFSIANHTQRQSFIWLGSTLECIRLLYPQFLRMLCVVHRLDLGIASICQ